MISYMFCWVITYDRLVAIVFTGEKNEDNKKWEATATFIRACN